MSDPRGERIRILLIEDSPGDARLLQEMFRADLSASFELVTATRLSAGLDRLAGDDIEVVLLDLTLPDSEGYETFATLSAQAPHTPIIVLSGLADESLAVRAVREGAQDYFVKGQFSDKLLIRAIWYAIERKQAEEEIRRRAAHLEALNAVIAAAAAATSAPELLETALGNTLDALRLEKGLIWQANHLAARGIDDRVECERILEAAAANDWAAEQIIVEEEWEESAGEPTPDDRSQIGLLLEQCDVIAFLVVPIMVEERHVGGLAVGSSSPRHWLAEEIALLQAIGQQLGAATERLHLFQAEREQRELAEALAEAAAVVSSTIELDQVLDRILEQVERVVPGDAFNVVLLGDDGCVQVTRSRGYDRFPEAADAVIRQINEESPFPAGPDQLSEPVVIQDTALAPDWQRPDAQWIRSYVGAPIQVGQETVGFLNVDGSQKNQFDSADARQLQAFANHAAAAIRNAQLYRETLEHAEVLEQRVEERTAQLQGQYAQLDATLRSSSDGIIVTDNAGDILQANPVALSWLNRTLSPEDATLLREAARDLTRHAEERHHTVLELAGLDLELRVAPITAPGAEEAAAAVVAVHDVSHLKAMDRIKSRFVSNVSHQLRTPITTIKLYAQLMKRQSAEELQHSLEMIEQEANQLAQLVQDILQLSSIDSGRMVMKPRPTSLNELVDTVIINHQVLAQEQGLDLEHRLSTPDTIALVDPGQTVQVLANLVTNAIQYTPKGGKAVISTGKEQAEGRDWATVMIEDTGMGIPEDEKSQIFERFFRGNRSRSMQIPGTGLGLAIAKEIVELQGGHIAVESQVDKGTTFAVWLPLAD